MFDNGRGTAVNAGGLTCDGTVYLNEGFQATGRVDFTDATVGHEFNCTDGRFTDFRAPRLRVAGEFNWQPRECTTRVDISFGDVGLVRDSVEKWPTGRRENEGTSLAGFTFASIFYEADRPEAEARIKWLSEIKYAPGMYRQVARSYREKGFSRAANAVVVAGHRDRRRRGQMKRWSRLWSRFLDHSVLYGYALHRALLFFLVWARSAGRCSPLPRIPA